MLLLSGADQNLTDNSGYSALNVAEQNGRFVCADLLLNSQKHGYIHNDIHSNISFDVLDNVVINTVNQILVAPPLPSPPPPPLSPHVTVLIDPKQFPNHPGKLSYFDYY